MTDDLRRRAMQDKEVFDELKTILVSRLKFDPRRAADVVESTPLPKGVEGSIGLDSLDFIELSIAIEERFGVVVDESDNLTEAGRAAGLAGRVGRRAHDRCVGLSGRHGGVRRVGCHAGWPRLIQFEAHRRH